MKGFVKGNLAVRVFPTRQEMGAAAAQEGAACLKRLLETRETINVMFAAAPSQNELLAGLEEGGIRVNDPNSPQNSEKLWAYDTLEPQIRNLWAFSLA